MTTTIKTGAGQELSTFEVHDPASGRSVGSYPVHSAADVDATVATAHDASAWWAALGFTERRRRLDAWRAEIARGRTELAEIIHTEMGKPVSDAKLEIAMALEHLKWAADNAEKVLGATVFARRNGRQIADRIRSGGTSINAFVAHATIPTLPLGGIGSSGFGRVHGPDGLEEFTYAKATTRQRFPSPLALTTFARSAAIDTVVDRLVSVLHGRTR